MFGWFASPEWRGTTIWSLDLETSGLDPHRDAILSAGMLPIREGRIRWGERYYALVRPPRIHRPSRDAMAVHHILPADAERAPRVEEVLDEVVARLDGAAILVHYGRLDLGFLRAVSQRLERRWPRLDVIDTVKLLGRLTFTRRRLDPYAEALPAELGKACAEFDLPHQVRHHALYDALATAELFLVLTERLGAKTMRQLR